MVSAQAAAQLPVAVALVLQHSSCIIKGVLHSEGMRRSFFEICHGCGCYQAMT